MEYYKNFNKESLTTWFNGSLFTEEWRSVVGFEKFYMVSSFGRIISLRENNIMKQHTNDHGYLAVSFSNGKIKKKMKVHRVVAFAFIPNPENKEQVNHDDFDKTNNFFMNLAWNTNSENFEHARKGGKVKIKTKFIEKVGERPIRSKKIINSQTGVVYENVYLLSLELKLTPKHIRKLLSGEVKNNTPYRWIKGQYSLFYRKKHEAAVIRYHELRKIIYGVSI